MDWDQLRDLIENRTRKEAEVLAQLGFPPGHLSLEARVAPVAGSDVLTLKATYPDGQSLTVTWKNGEEPGAPA